MILAMKPRLFAALCFATPVLAPAALLAAEKSPSPAEAPTAPKRHPKHPRPHVLPALQAAPATLPLG